MILIRYKTPGVTMKHNDAKLCGKVRNVGSVESTFNNTKHCLYIFASPIKITLINYTNFKQEFCID